MILLLIKLSYGLIIKTCRCLISARRVWKVYKKVVKALQIQFVWFWFPFPNKLFMWLPKENSFIFSRLTFQVELLMAAASERESCSCSYHLSPPEWRAPCPSRPRSEPAARQGDRKYTPSSCWGLTPAVLERWEGGGSLLQKGAAWMKLRLSEESGDIKLNNLRKYLLFANVHQLHCPPQPLNVFGCHLHHLFDFSTFLGPGRDTLDSDPFCKALGSKSLYILKYF